VQKLSGHAASLSLAELNALIWSVSLELHVPTSLLFDIDRVCAMHARDPRVYLDPTMEIKWLSAFAKMGYKPEAYLRTLGKLSTFRFDRVPVRKAALLAWAVLVLDKKGKRWGLSQLWGRMTKHHARKQLAFCSPTSTWTHRSLNRLHQVCMLFHSLS
jgi:hypothetical protein